MTSLLHSRNLLRRARVFVITFLAAMLLGPSAGHAAAVFAYGLGALGNEGFSTFDTATPGDRTIIAATDGAEIYGLTFDLSGTTLYGVNNDTKTLETIDQITGARTVVVNLSGIADGHTLSGLSIDPLTGVMFLSTTNISTSNLYTIDPATGVATLVGVTGIGGVVDISFDLLGMLYATDISSDSLFSLNTLTGASTLIGALGIDLNFAQGMDFDFSTGILYAALYSGGGNAQWSTINTTTGAATSLFEIDREMEIAIARSPRSVPEPSSLVLLGMSVFGMGILRRIKARPART